ncbi:hypothetical protein Mal64_24540 [Pseudobythopirellula maris]|uniref:PilZ domain-containing protein n=1 Tax=Pseudobythopirellula maris TaxID=2527991 RepID=A0A5C5ZRW3_9BACT|nr:PilZ domain-containing protein [Pseudobythopirellula maris]TWT88963.1 hypothetical protein Mal64_24540 [Pseudobythopirellula maris]
MLDVALSTEVDDGAWGSLAARASLPIDSEIYYNVECNGLTPEESRRRFRRVPIRGRAVLVRGQSRYGVYAVDVSPMGIGVYSPKQLFPKECVTIFIADREPIDLALRRCKREAPNAYLCGLVFPTGPLGPSQYRNFINSMR